MKLCPNHGVYIGFIETLPELGQDVRRLAHLAYPTAPKVVRETLAKEQFIDALIDVDMRSRIKQARSVSLNDAVRHAVCFKLFRYSGLACLFDFKLFTSF
jgi:hypothetical protein